MARYTIALRVAIRNLVFQSEDKKELLDYDNHDELIETGLKYIFDFDYPIFDETYRPVLEKKIIKHYYMREINETPFQLWKFKLNTLMNEIMPYYNDLYLLDLKEFDIFANVDMVETYLKNESEGTSSKIDEISSLMGGSKTNSKNNENNTSQQIENDTPMSRLTDVDYASKITDLTNKNNADMTSTNDVVNNGKNLTDKKVDVKTTQDYLKTIKGKNNFMTNTQMLIEARKSLQNIDMKIIEELGELFFMIYN